METRNIIGDLVIGKEGYVFKGNLNVTDGTIIIDGGELLVEGNLSVSSTDKRTISVVNGGISAHSLSTNLDIYIKNGNIMTFENLCAGNIHSDNGDIIVGGDTNVIDVYCRNYLVYGCNNSLTIEGTASVYIKRFSFSYNIKAPEVFLGDGGNFNGGHITANHFKFDGHVFNCLRRYLL